jgi:hypothetical protein
VDALHSFTDYSLVISLNFRRRGGSLAGGRCRGGKPLSSVDVAVVMLLTARSNASSVAGDVVCTPLTFRTYWRAADSISSAVASGSRPLRMVMFLHMP